MPTSVVVHIFPPEFPLAKNKQAKNGAHLFFPTALLLASWSLVVLPFLFILASPLVSFSFPLFFCSRTSSPSLLFFLVFTSSSLSSRHCPSVCGCRRKQAGKSSLWGKSETYEVGNCFTKKIASKWHPNCVHGKFWRILRPAPQNYTRTGFYDLKFT